MPLGPRASPQIALAERLAKLVTTLPEPVVTVYYEAFLHTMRREWSGIDHLRIDKFMMLVRKFFFCALQRMRDDKWCVEGFCDGVCAVVCFDDRKPVTRDSLKTRL